MLALGILRWIVAISFLLLGAWCTLDFARHRSRRRGYAAMAIGLLALITTFSQILTIGPITLGIAHDPLLGYAMADIVLIAFTGSALGLFLYHGSLFPTSRATTRTVYVLLGLSAVFTLSLPIPISTPGATQTHIAAPVLLSVLYTIVLWMGIACFVVGSFWSHSNALPRVQQARLRALASAYVLLLLVLAVSLITGSRGVPSLPLSLAAESITILFVPLMFMALYPPAALRGLWRMGEETEFASELNNLVTLSPSPQSLAEDSAVWATNLVGAEGCAIFDEKERIIALYRLDIEEALQLLDDAPPPRGEPGSIKVPMPMGEETGTVVLKTGPITPEFGSDEIARLSLYISHLGAAFTRINLIESLQDSQEATLAASKAKNDFLARMSHELRTPLGAILGFAEILMTGLEGELSTPQHEDIVRIHTAGKHLLSLLDQLLDLSRIEAGRMELFPTEMDVTEVIARTLDSLTPLAQEKGLELRLDTPSVPPVTADLQKVRQVLLNLLGNAIKFTDNGTVTVRCMHDAPTTVRIEVEDTGVGLPAGDISRVFGEFIQGNPDIVQPRGGTGLGLAISKSIVELHGGEMGCTSVPGMGSTFWFTLPLSDASAEIAGLQPRVPREEDDDEESERNEDVVIVVDEDAVARSHIAKQLKIEGIHCIEAESVNEVLQIAQTIRPSAITISLAFPLNEEIQGLKRLRSRKGTRNVPVVLVSKHDFNQMVIPVDQVSFVQKPLSSRQIITSMTEFLHGLEDRTVLIVDDDPDMRTLLGRMLKREHATVLTAEDGPSGIDLAIVRQPDLIIADLIMPEMSGFEMISRLRAIPETSGIPIIVASAKDMDAGDFARLDGLIDQYIAKTMLFETDLGFTIRQIINDQHQTRQPLRSLPR